MSWQPWPVIAHFEPRVTARGEIKTPSVEKQAENGLTFFRELYSTISHHLFGASWGLIGNAVKIGDGPAAVIGDNCCITTVLGREGQQADEPRVRRPAG